MILGRCLLWIVPVELLAEQRLLYGDGVLEVVWIGVHYVGVAPVQLVTLRSPSTFCVNLVGLRRTIHASRVACATSKRLAIGRVCRRISDFVYLTNMQRIS